MKRKEVFRSKFWRIDYEEHLGREEQGE